MTKKFDVKKQIAFIASLALLAGNVAAYVPVASTLFGANEIVASAKAASTVNYATYAPTLSGLYVNNDTSDTMPTVTGYVDTTAGATVTGDGSASNPWVVEFDLKNAGSKISYGTVIDYTLAAKGASTIMDGGTGEITADSKDNTFVMPTIKVRDSDKKDYYYQYKIHLVSDQNTYVTTTNPATSATVNSLFTVNYTKNTGSKTTVPAETGVSVAEADAKYKYVEGYGYVRKIDVAVPADVLAKSQVTVKVNSAAIYGVAENTDAKFDNTTVNCIPVTLGDDGTAKQYVTIKSEKSDVKINEVYELNFRLIPTIRKFTDAGNSSAVNPNDGLGLTFDAGLDYTSYNLTYEAKDEHYTAVYTIRAAKPETNITTVNQAEPTSITPGDFAFGDTEKVKTVAPETDTKIYEYVADTDLTVEGATPGWVPSNCYIKVVYNPTYTIKFMDEKGENEYTEYTNLQATVNGKYPTLPTPTKTGYKFVSWNTSTNGTTANGTPIYTNLPVAQGHGTTLYADFEAIKYYLKFNANGGGFVTGKLGSLNSDNNYDSEGQLTSASVNGGVTYDGLATSINKDVLSRSGYNLLGFSTSATATKPDEGLAFGDGTTVSIPSTLSTSENSTVTLYAVWAVADHKITFSKNTIVDKVDKNTAATEGVIGLSLGKNADGTDVSDTKDVATGDAVGVLPVPTLKGWTFKGWYYDKDSTANEEWVAYSSSSTMPADDITLVAYFTQNNYTITNKGFVDYDNKATGPSKKLVIDASKLPTGFVFDKTGAFAFKDWASSTDNNYIDYPKDSGAVKTGYIFKGYTINGKLKTEDNPTTTTTDETAYFAAADIKNYLSDKGTEYTTYDANGKATNVKNYAAGTENVTIEAVWDVDAASALISVDFDKADITYNRGVSLGGSIFSGSVVNTTIRSTSSAYKTMTDIFGTIVGKPGDRISVESTYDNYIDDPDNMDTPDVDYFVFTKTGFRVDDLDFTLSKEGYTFDGWYIKNDDGTEKAWDVSNDTFVQGITKVYAKFTAEGETEVGVPAITGVTATAKYDESVAKNSITVNWDKASGVDGYCVYFRNASGKLLGSRAVTGTSYTSTSLNYKSGSTVTVQVCGYVGDEKGEYTSKTVDIPASATADTTIKNLKATAVDSTINVSWTAVEGATKYKAYVYDAKGKLKASKAVSTNSASFTSDKLFAAGSTYTVKVWAVVGGVEQEKSSVDVTMPEAQEVAEVKNVKATAVTGYVTTTWDAVKGATKYAVYYYNEDGTRLASKSVTGTSYTTSFMKTVVTGETITVAVRATLADGTVTEFTKQTAVVGVGTPADLTASKSGTTVKASWTALAGVDGYAVYFRDASGKKLGSKAVTTNSVSSTASNYGTDVYVQVKAYKLDANGKKVYGSFCESVKAE